MSNVISQFVSYIGTYSVIASITATNLALVATESTRSGLHDLQRVANLTKHFGVQTLVCINKWDLNKDMAAHIQRWATMRKINVSGKIRYDHAATKAQIYKISIVEYQDYGIAEDIKKLWPEVDMQLGNTQWLKS